MVLTRTETLGITSIQLTDDYRLDDSVDEQTKTIEKLKKEVQLLKDRLPKVGLLFSDEEKFVVIDCTNRIAPGREKIDEELMAVKSEIPYLIPSHSSPKNNLLGAFYQLSQERIDEYNGKLEKYYMDYRVYLDEYYKYLLISNNTIALEFGLFNTGSKPAEDVDVWLHLPDGFNVVDEPVKAPVKPRAPYRPSSNFDFGPAFGAPIISFTDHLGTTPTISFDKPTIKQTNSFEVTYHCKFLKHGMKRIFDPIYLEYRKETDIANFNIEYRLNIANFPEPVVGKLNVIFKK
jgi:hypothetical protein